MVNRFSRLTLPSNATSIRSDITDNFSCAGRPYGYYADVENDCQIFHVCLPVTYPDGQERQFRWSFICPEETTFNQVWRKFIFNTSQILFKLIPTYYCYHSRPIFWIHQRIGCYWINRIWFNMNIDRKHSPAFELTRWTLIVRTRNVSTN